VSDSAGPVFSALSDPTRREVVQRLSEHGPLSATALAAELPISRQAVSKHLAALADAGLVHAERVGREMRYSLTVTPVHGAVSWLADIGAEWDERLAALQEHLARPQRS